jgi:general secretion pathway protein L
VFLKRSLRGVNLGAHGVCPLPQDGSEEDRLAAVEACVADFVSRHRIAPEGVFLGLGGELAISRRLEFPQAVKENLRETLRYEMEKYIPVPVDEVCYDYQIISEDKATKQLSLLLVMAKKRDIVGYCQLADRLRVVLSGIEPRLGALVNFLSGPGGMAGDDATALSFVETGRLNEGLVSGHRLVYSGSRPIGKSAGDLAGAVSGSIERIKRLIPDGEDPLRVWLFGDPMAEDATAALEADAEVAVHRPLLESTPLPSWELAPAYGLALKGLRQVPVQIDLVPEGLRKKPSRIGYFLMVALAVLVLLAGLAWGGSHMLYQRRIQDRMDAEIESLAEQIKTVDQIQAESKRIEEWIAYLNNMRRGGIPILDLLADVTERIPETAWVRDLTLNESELRLDGYADSASELLPLLDESPFFKEVAFLSTITKGKDGKERFRVGGKIEQPDSGGETAK